MVTINCEALEKKLEKRVFFTSRLVKLIYFVVHESNINGRIGRENKKSVLAHEAKCKAKAEKEEK